MTISSKFADGIKSKLKDKLNLVDRFSTQKAQEMFGADETSIERLNLFI